LKESPLEILSRRYQLSGGIKLLDERCSKK